MQKKTRQVTTFFLILVYACSFLPSMQLFHHHDSLVDYQTASDCEKTAYYHDTAEGCSHNSHFLKDHQDCALCDHHYLSTHVPTALSASVDNTQVSYLNIGLPGFPHSIDIEALPSRAPPEIV